MSAAKKRVEKPRVRSQGCVIVERCRECDACQEWLLEPAQAPECFELLVLCPDGRIKCAASSLAAYRIASAYFREKMDDRAINVGRIEWRNDVKPPKVEDGSPNVVAKVGGAL